MKRPARVAGTIFEVVALAFFVFSVARLYSERLTPAGRPDAAQPQNRYIAAGPCAGDSNFDGARDIRDAVLIENHILGKQLLAGQALADADVNADSRVDVRDIVRLVRHVLGRAPLADCTPAAASSPFIRYIAPVTGLKGVPFTLLGHGFSSTPANNTVIFSRPGSMIQATLTSASATTLVGAIPATLDTKLYAVNVTVGGKQSNAVGYTVRTTASALVLRPSTALLLMPPGTGRETLVIGGGTPPYKLSALAAADNTKISAILKGNTIEVTGIADGQPLVKVTDSAATPATAESTVIVRKPTFAPEFDIGLASLLAGSAPSFSIRVRTVLYDMKLVKTRIKFSRAGATASAWSGRDLIGTSRQGFSNEIDYAILEVSDVLSASSLNFEVKRKADDNLEVSGRGTLENIGGSATLTILNVPEPPPEAYYPGDLTTDFVISGNLVRLPAAADETMTVTVEFTSVSVVDGANLPMTRVVSKTFRTVGVAAGAPTITGIGPIQGEIGHIVQISGSGFSTTAADNKVTFAESGNQRIDATVLSATAGALRVVAPLRAVTGPVQVTVANRQSNDYAFSVLFRPEAGLFFPEFKANTPVAPIFLVRQEPGEISLASIKVTLNEGRINVSGLEKDKPAGTGNLSSQPGVLQYVIYRGQETSGDRRHFFDVNSNLESTSGGYVQLFLSDSSGGKGIVFEMMPTSQVEWGGVSLAVRFDKPIYLPSAAAGTVVTSTTEMGSVQWNFFPGAAMRVVVTNEAPIR